MQISKIITIFAMILTQLAILSISKPPKQPKSIDSKILKAWYSVWYKNGFPQKSFVVPDKNVFDWYSGSYIHALYSRRYVSHFNLLLLKKSYIFAQSKLQVVRNEQKKL